MTVEFEKMMDYGIEVWKRIGGWNSATKLSAASDDAAIYIRAFPGPFNTPAPSIWRSSGCKAVTSSALILVSSASTA